MSSSFLSNFVQIYMACEPGLSQRHGREGNGQMTSKLVMPSRRTKARRRLFDRRLLRCFGHDTNGGVLIYTALLLPVLPGITGLAIDVSTRYAGKRVAWAATTVRESKHYG